jgi:hypothetical protein
VLERPAIEVPRREQLAMHLPDGLPTANRQRSKDAVCSFRLGAAWPPVRQRDAVGRSAHIAEPTRRARVATVSEMLHELEHAASALFGVAPDSSQLLEPVRSLPLVRDGKGCVAATDGLVGVDARAAVHPQLLEHLLEHGGSEP